MGGKQSVKNSVWYIEGRKRYRKRTKRGQRVRGFPIGLITAAYFQVKLQNLYLKKFSVVEGKDDDEAKPTVPMTRYTTEDSITKRCIVPSEI